MFKKFSAADNSHVAVSFSTSNFLTISFSINMVYLLDLIPRPFSDLSTSAPIALVKLRNTAKPVQVKIKTHLEKKSASVMLKNPEFGISPGQAAVFYDLVDKNRVLGGGWIIE